MAAYRHVAFFSSPGLTEIDGAEGQGRVHTLEFLTPLAGEARRQIGCYEDHYLREAGVWRFARRSFTQVS